MNLHETIRRLHTAFVASHEIGCFYQMEMTLQALCELHVLEPQHNWLEAVETVWAKRGWGWNHDIDYVTQPFAAHNGALARVKKEPDAIRQVYVDQTALMLKHEPRGSEGRILHWSPRLSRNRT